MLVENEVLRLQARVTELEERLDFLYKSLNLTYSSTPPQDDPRIIEQLRKGNKIEAIKIYREIHPSGLAEAKDAIEAISVRVLGR
jgi:ribosomal protein L7/L12